MSLGEWVLVPSRISVAVASETPGMPAGSRRDPDGIDIRNVMDGHAMAFQDQQPGAIRERSFHGPGQLDLQHFVRNRGTLQADHARKGDCVNRAVRHLCYGQGGGCEGEDEGSLSHDVGSILLTWRVVRGRGFGHHHHAVGVPQPGTRRLLDVGGGDGKPLVGFGVDAVGIVKQGGVIRQADGDTEHTFAGRGDGALDGTAGKLQFFGGHRLGNQPRDLLRNSAIDLLQVKSYQAVRKPPPGAWMDQRGRPPRTRSGERFSCPSRAS